MISADSSVFVASDAKDVDPSGADVNLTATFTGQPYVRALYNGNAAAKDIKVTTVGGNATLYTNVPSGGRIFGLFTLLWKVGTTATGIVAEM